MWHFHIRLWKQIIHCTQPMLKYGARKNVDGISWRTVDTKKPKTLPTWNAQMKVINCSNRSTTVDLKKKK